MKATINRVMIAALIISSFYVGRKWPTELVGYNKLKHELTIIDGILNESPPIHSHSNSIEIAKLETKSSDELAKIILDSQISGVSLTAGRNGGILDPWGKKYSIYYVNENGNKRLLALSEGSGLGIFRPK